jgi:hypothetical protein
MRGSADRDQLHALDAGFDEVAGSWRPDLIGGVRVWTGPESYTEANYFTSEAEAREGEKKAPPSELAAQADNFEKLMAHVDYSDLRDPWLY